jgi:hypothetical protein
MKKDLFGLLLCTLVIVSCGGESEEKSGVRKGVFVTRHPIEFTSACNSSDDFSFSTFSNLIYTVPEFNGLMSQPTKLDMTDYVNSSYLNDYYYNSISKTIYGKELSATFKHYYDSRAKKYQQVIPRYATIYDQGRELEICSNKRAYQRFTYEAAGLVVTRYIQQAKRALDAVDPDNTVAAVTVQIGKKSKYVYDFQDGPSKNKQKVMYESDNAYYVKSRKEITFLPHSKEYQKLFPTFTPYWEVPMISAHEYGHHIYSHYMHNGSDSTERSKVGGCFKSPMQHEHHHQHVNSMKLKNSFKGATFIGTSINEGFADLFARYSLEGEKGNVGHVACLQITRDVSSPHFANKEAKRLTHEGIKIMESDQMISTSKNCDHPNFQDTHHIGAIFAYAVHSYIDQFTSTNKERLAFLIDWIKQARTRMNQFQYTKGSDIFNVFLKDTLKYAADYFGQTDSNKLCQHYAQFVTSEMVNNNTDFFYCQDLTY